jgi:hypothetical protein
MALTTTYLNQTSLNSTGTNVRLVTLNAYTAPTRNVNETFNMLRFATGEYCLITDETNSPTLTVVRGFYGSTVATHFQYEGVQYGRPSDFPAESAKIDFVPTVSPINTQEVTMTGTTGTSAASVTIAPIGFLGVTGATGGINLPSATVGMSYTIQNHGTGSVLIYCTASGPSTGCTINGNAGATGFTLTTTGNKMAWAYCDTVGAWLIGGNT